MINEVDEALRALMKAEVAGEGDIDVVFDAPSREWASTRTKSTIDLYLYDIREDLQRRQTGVVERRNDQGVVDGRLDVPRFYELSYLVSAWTPRPEDEHRLLSAVLACCMVHDTVPAGLMPPLLAELGLPLRLQIAQADDRKGLNVWSSLGSDLKPSVDLVVSLPLRPSSFYEVAQVVMEPLRLHTYGWGTMDADDGVKQRGGAAPEAGGAPAKRSEVKDRVAEGRSRGGSGGRRARPR